jgi:hypothetical protein
MLPMSQVTAVTQYIAKVGRYNQLGANGLKDKRHQHPGTQPLISQVQQAQMKQTLQTPPADGGLWNRRKVAEGLSNFIGPSSQGTKELGLSTFVGVSVTNTPTGT